jgi:uncharacterized DUF497 family protein
VLLVDFEWDPKKAEQNRRKHGVEFVDAVVVLDDDRAIKLEDEHPRVERYLTFGMDAAATDFWQCLIRSAAASFE